MARTSFRKPPEPVIIQRPERPTRPTRPQAEPELKGGWMSNPPETCKHRKYDGSKFFVEASMCAYHCPVNSTCKVWALFQEGSKDRKKFTTETEVVETVKPVEPAPETKINRRRR